MADYFTSFIYPWPKERRDFKKIILFDYLARFEKWAEPKTFQHLPYITGICVQIFKNRFCCDSKNQTLLYLEVVVDLIASVYIGAVRSMPNGKQYKNVEVT